MPEAQNIQGNIHVDRYLTDFSVGYVQSATNFVAGVASSTIPVTNQSNKYVVYERGFFWRNEAKPRPLGGAPVQVGYKIGEGNYSAIEYALEHTIDDRQRANVDAPIRLDENATKLLSGKHMIKADVFWANAFFKTGIWGNDYSGVASSPAGKQFLQFNDPLSDPIAAIDQLKDAIHSNTGFMPNTIVLGSDVKRQLRSHPDIADRIKYTRVGVADEQILAALFEVEKVVTARGIQTTSDEGQTDTFGYIVDPKGVWIGYIERNPGLDSPTAIANFAWTGLIPGATNAIGGVIERGRDNRAHSDYFQMRMAWDMQPVATDLGGFITTAVA